MVMPTSLYLHFPWCVKKCPYCDFNSHPLKTDLSQASQADYIDRLLEDFRLDWSQHSQPDLNSIFLGGGTPTLFSVSSIERLLNGIGRLGISLEGVEITLEANPGTFEQDKFRGFREAGINRLSIGVQSFEDDHLVTLGRIHTAAQAQRAFLMARQAGFENINLDLMHGLPNQSTAQALSDLEVATRFRPDHISWYQLTLEPKTEFAKRPPPLPSELVLAEIESSGLEVLADAGYQRYEVSGFAQPGKRCQHNLNYWQFGDYLGAGAGAHGKLSDPNSGSLVRTSKPSQPRNYAKTRVDRLQQVRTVATQDVAGEFMMNALRLIEGVPETLFQQRTFQPLSTIAQPLERMRRLGLMQPHRLALTQRGLRYLDSVVGEFLPA